MGNTYRPVGTTLHGVGEAAPHPEAVPCSPNKRVTESTWCKVLAQARDCLT
jgi:hypothetical protein